MKKGEKKLNLSFGGDSAYYLSVISILKAIEELKLDIDEIHCTGFSCIPIFYSEYFKSSDKAYPRIKEIYKDVVKTFKFLGGFIHMDVVNQMFMLYKMQRGMNGITPQRHLINFVNRNFPKFELERLPRVKIHAFNLENFSDEVLSGNVQEAMCATLCFPVQFSPYKNYISGVWVYGVPKGDIIITMKSEDQYKPKNAIDYMILSTLGRTKEIIKIRSQSAKFTFEFEVESFDPSRNSLKIYEVAMERFSEIIKTKN
ncbi:MAG: hypothetical protein PWQ72_1508 [Pseudothermotoga sp.]|nr:hypothetical protein [Pseudothermotoga sp.]